MLRYQFCNLNHTAGYYKPRTGINNAFLRGSETCLSSQASHPAAIKYCVAFLAVSKKSKIVILGICTLCTWTLFCVPASDGGNS